ncbi:MAG: methyl-accepting chemotaxis protein [Treponema sp.]|jgi:methyl-accepting chemotaxis protein|nr:methyl-accepting chemotaxis protein [Treponema sp.]
MKKTTVFRIYVFASILISIVTTVGIFLQFAVVRVLNANLWVRIIIPSIVFAAAEIILLGRFAAPFKESNFKISGDVYKKALSAVGAVPLKLMSFYLLLTILYLSSLFMQSRAFETASAIVIPLFILSLAVIMLNASFLYVLCDSLISKALMSFNLFEYPHDLKAHRQSLKSFICPLAVSLITILFGVSVPLLVIHQSGGTIESLSRGDWGTIIILLLVFFSCCQILGFMLKKSTSRVYNNILKQLSILSSAQKDLTKRVSVCSVDEIGTMTGMVNAFCENLQSGMKDLIDGQSHLSLSGDDLGSSSLEMTTSLQAIKGKTDLVRNKTQHQMNSVEASGSAVQQIAENIGSLDKLISDQAASVTEASAAVEEMVSNIASISTAVEKMTNRFSIVNISAQEGMSVQTENGKMVSQIIERSQSLQEANKIIATIAAQTNLLAMNAAIEAAHAGEAGRGFSVVADEIRRLAEKSSQESRSINAELKEVEKIIGFIVSGTKGSEAAFNNVADKINEVEPVVMEVNRAMHEQMEGAKQVLDALHSMNDITIRVRDGSREMSEGNTIVVREMDQLHRSAMDMSSSMDEMVQGLVSLNTEAEKVSNLADSSKDTIVRMNKTVESFTV